MAERSLTGITTRTSKLIDAAICFLIYRSSSHGPIGGRGRRVGVVPVVADGSDVSILFGLECCDAEAALGLWIGLGGIVDGDGVRVV